MMNTFKPKTETEYKEILETLRPTFPKLLQFYEEAKEKYEALILERGPIMMTYHFFLLCPKQVLVGSRIVDGEEEISFSSIDYGFKNNTKVDSFSEIINLIQNGNNNF